MRWSLVTVTLALAIGCSDGGDAIDAGGAECSDGRDNDGDGMVDFPEDPGCAELGDTTEDSLAAPACSDHRDNDHDGKTDYPEDPGCIIPQADSEDDDCPGGRTCPQCANGLDDDINGMRDFPGDPGCDSAADPVEFTTNPVACGAKLMIKPLPASNMDTGTLDLSSTSSLVSPCGGTAGVPAVAYLMVLTEPAVVVATTAGSTADTVLDLRGAACQPVEAELACNDNVAGTDKTSKLTRSLRAGAYYLVVSGKLLTSVGAYSLRVDKLPGEGTACTDTSQCGPGLICRIPFDKTTMMCSLPVCSDGLDDDGDGRVDYPDDPGCTHPGDATELDGCRGPGCPACADGIDNDDDGAADYPLDHSCTAASDASEQCVTTEPIGVIVAPTTTGDTTGVTNDFDPTCNAAMATAPDLLYRIELPTLTALHLNVNNAFGATTSLLGSACGNPPIRCIDRPDLDLTNLAGGTYYVSIEGKTTAGVGPFTITTSGTIAPNGSCEGELFESGALVCPPSYVCEGPAGDRRCHTECSDLVDNNGDGKVDYPEDPGCLTPEDHTENTVCPGASCPVCSDGLDNDGDSAIDYPDDASCEAASGDSEHCVTSEPIGQIVGQVTAGTTVGAVNDTRPRCVTGPHTAPDLVYQLALPAMRTLDLRLTGPGGMVFDGAHSLFNASCAGTPIACSDPQLMSVASLAAGTYYVVVDGFDTNAGPFELTTSGTIAPRGSCEGPLFANGTIACSPGYTCGGTPGARTCRTECTDDLDNNGDGKIDYPNDPGCVNPDDNVEATVCPGPACPECSDGADNDSDTQTDYPGDSNCIAAGGASEVCVYSEPILPITGTTTTGTTTGAVNDYKPVCALATNHSAPDLVYELSVPALQSLTLVLTGGALFDGATSLLDTRCGSIACTDNTNLTVPNVPPGRYFVVVDGFADSAGAFTLTTSGTIAAGASCEGPLAAAGTLKCPTGLPCAGPPGARTCVSQCSDGIDNNADGRRDFPNDPSCSSLADNTEINICPGPTCPQCGNGLDDDADGMLDFPADVGCASASGTSETFCGIEPQFRGAIAAPVTLGTLAAPATNNYNQSCQVSTGNDVAYALVLPVPVRRLVVSTIGSTITDTVLSVNNSLCTQQLACDDDGDPAGNLSLITLDNVAAGNYAIEVDAYATSGANHGPFQLNVTGSVASGLACTSPLFAAGVLTCQGGPCTAGVCP